MDVTRRQFLKTGFIAGGSIALASTSFAKELVKFLLSNNYSLYISVDETSNDAYHKLTSKKFNPERDDYDFEPKTKIAFNHDRLCNDPHSQDLFLDGPYDNKVIGKVIKDGKFDFFQRIIDDEKKMPVIYDSVPCPYNDSLNNKVNSEFEYLCKRFKLEYDRPSANVGITKYTDDYVDKLIEKEKNDPDSERKQSEIQYKHQKYSVMLQVGKSTLLYIQEWKDDNLALMSWYSDNFLQIHTPKDSPRGKKVAGLLDYVKANEKGRIHQ